MQRSAASWLARGVSPSGVSLRLPGVVRVLVAYEDAYLVYRDALVRAIRARRPRAAVLTAGLRDLEFEVERLEPHLVVSSRSSTVDAGGGTAWYKLSPEPDEFSEVCIGERRLMYKNPGLEELVSVVGEVEKAIRVRGPLGGR